MAGEALEPLYLIVGGDAPKVSLALRRLRSRFDPGSIDHLNASEATAADAVAAANALGLFGDGERLVVVEGVERWKKADVDSIAAFAASPAPGAVLALTGDRGKLPAGLESAVGGPTRVLRYEVPTRRRGAKEVADFPSWARARLEALRVRADRGVAERLVELVGEDAFALEAEAAKLASFSGDDVLTVRDVERLVAPAADESSFALVDAWGARDVAGALGACEAQLAHEEVFRVAVRLADHAGKVRAVHELLEEGLPVKAIAQRLGLKDYPARKQAGQAANFTREELERSVVRLATVDFALKGGSRLPATLELERALVELASKPERS